MRDHVRMFCGFSVRGVIAQKDWVRIHDPRSNFIAPAEDSDDKKRAGNLKEVCRCNVHAKRTPEQIADAG
jgi:hypothetical protein